MSIIHPEWLFDESIQVGIDYTDVNLVSDYDRQHKKFRNFEQEARKIAIALDLSEGSVVLDIGCGTGGISTHLARICKHIYAVDISPAMIAVLERKIQEQEIKNVCTVQSGFLNYQHSGKDLDAIVANINLHHLPDFWKQIALCRFYDLLKSGGRMFLADVVFGFDPRDYQEEIDGWLESMRDIAGPQMADETVIHVRDEFSTWEWIMTGMLVRAGFQIDSNLEIMPHMRAYICSK
jgi:ubiquinone/menaquinone biosynthesis C-methylase UbiE